MTKFANLSLEAIEIIAGSPPGEEVEEAIRLVSEKKDLSKVTKGTLVKVVEYLFREYDFLKEKDQDSQAKAQTVTNKENPSAQPVKTVLSEESLPNATHVAKSEDHTGEKPEKTCKFFRSGKCRHGKTGRTVVDGKTCPHKHPKVCMNSKKLGRCKEGRDCKFMHLSTCREWMKGRQCRFGEKCRFFHPQGLKVPEEKMVKVKEPSPKRDTEKPQELRKDAEEAFLGQQTTMINLMERMTTMLEKLHTWNGYNHHHHTMNNNKIWT